MTKQTPGSLLLVGAIAGGAGFVAFVALMVVGQFAVSPSAFFAILIFLAAAIVLFQGFHRAGDATDRVARAPVPGDRTFENRTVEPGTAGVRPGSAGASALADGAAGSRSGDPSATPSSPAVAPGPDTPPGHAGNPPSSATGAMPDTPRESDADRDADRHVTSASGTSEAAYAESAPADAAAGQSGAAADRVVSRERESAEQAPAPKVRSGTLLQGEEDLATRKGSWRYEREMAPAGGAAADMPESAVHAEVASAPAGAAGDGHASSGHGLIGVEPPRLSEARPGGADDLKRIKGVGPKLEELLHRLGFFHYDQIAAWNPKEVLWVDEHLEGFKGRVDRDDWVDQARRLASGHETEFSSRADAGDDPP